MFSLVKSRIVISLSKCYFFLSCFARYLELVGSERDFARSKVSIITSEVRNVKTTRVLT